MRTTTNEPRRRRTWRRKYFHVGKAFSPKARQIMEAACPPAFPSLRRIDPLPFASAALHQSVAESLLRQLLQLDRQLHAKPSSFFSFDPPLLHAAISTHDAPRRKEQHPQPALPVRFLVWVVLPARGVRQRPRPSGSESEPSPRRGGDLLRGRFLLARSRISPGILVFLAHVGAVLYPR